MHRPAALALLVLLASAGLAPAGAAAADPLDLADVDAPDADRASWADGSAGQSDDAGDCSFPVTRTDASGTAVTVGADPDRVVALQPSAAQTMWEIGAREEVVGMPVGPYTADLEGYRRPRDVVGADGYTVVVEAVVDLDPDLVLAPNVTRTETLSTLREAGLTVYHFREARSIEDVYDKTALTGRLTGHCAGADERVRWMRDRIGRVQSAVEGEPRPTVVYPLGGGVVAGSGTFLHELVTAAGGRNLAAEVGISGYQQLSAEVIVARDPEWLLLNEGLPTSSIQMDAYNRTTAIRADQVVRLNPNYANQPAPRIVYPIEAIARALHPGAMSAANRTGSPVTTSAADQPPSGPSGPDDSRTTTPGLPGFGIPAGLVAIAVAVLAGTRRSR